MSNSAIDYLLYTRCSVPSPFSIAAQLGWIEEEFRTDGFEVRSLRESGRAEDRSSHFDHHLPNSFRQGGSVPAIWARSRGQATRVIALSWTDEYQAIIALPAARIQTIKDLRGRRIGIPRHRSVIDHNRASALRAFELALAVDGVGLADLELVDLDDDRYGQDDGEVRTGLSPQERRRHTYTSEAYALARGEVDAVYVKDVRGAELAFLLGAVVVADIGFHPDPFVRVSNCAPRPLTVSGELLDRRPDIVARLLARVVEAGRWAAEHPAETVRFVSAETGWSERWIRRAYGEDLHLRLGANLDETSVEGIGRLVADLAERGFIPKGFDARDWIDAAPLESLRRAGAVRSLAARTDQDLERIPA